MPVGMSCQDKNDPSRHTAFDNDCPVPVREIAPLGETLKRIRGATRQSEFAARLGISQSTLSRYESGSRQPDVVCLLRVAELYNTSVERLVRGADAVLCPDLGVAKRVADRELEVGERDGYYAPVTEASEVVAELARSPQVLAAVGHILSRKSGRRLLRTLGDLNDRQVGVLLTVARNLQRG